MKTPPLRSPPTPPARARAAAVLIALLATACDGQTRPAPATGPAPQSLPTMTVPVNGTPLTLQVAKEDATRETGLMYTRSMPADAGMIFVFPVERPLDFWMQNTPIDLDIAYLDHTGRVVSVKTMRAYDTTNVPSDEPATFAIELNAGAAARLKLTAGQHVDLPAGLTAGVR